MNKNSDFYLQKTITEKIGKMTLNGKRKELFEIIPHYLTFKKLLPLLSKPIG